MHESALKMVFGFGIPIVLDYCFCQNRFEILADNELYRCPKPQCQVVILLPKKLFQKHAFLASANRATCLQNCFTWWKPNRNFPAKGKSGNKSLEKWDSRSQGLYDTPALLNSHKRWCTKFAYLHQQRKHWPGLPSTLSVETNKISSPLVTCIDFIFPRAATPQSDCTFAKPRIWALHF